MSRTRPVVVLAAVCALLAAPAALAASPPVRLMVWVRLDSKLTATTAESTARTHTCQAGRSGATKTAAKTSLVGDARHVAVVACEQPPRAEVLPASSLERSVSGFIASEG